MDYGQTIETFFLNIFFTQKIFYVWGVLNIYQDHTKSHVEIESTILNAVGNDITSSM